MSKYEQNIAMGWSLIPSFHRCTGPLRHYHAHLTDTGPPPPRFIIEPLSWSAFQNLCRGFCTHRATATLVIDAARASHVMCVHVHIICMCVCARVRLPN